MFTRIITVREAFPVYFCPENWEMNKTDFTDYRKFVEVHLGEGFEFIGTFSEDVLVSVTAFRGGNVIEVHTFIDPLYRKDSVKIHKQHIDFFESLGKTGLVTQASKKNQASINYLCKRIGFLKNPSPYSSVTINGEKSPMYRLIYVFK